MTIEKAEQVKILVIKREKASEELSKIQTLLKKFPLAVSFDTKDPAIPGYTVDSHAVSITLLQLRYKQVEEQIKLLEENIKSL